MKYCQYCGEQLTDQGNFCTKCGKPVAHAVPNDRQELVEKLSSRLKTNGIIWIVIAAVQIVIGVCGAWGALIIGILNLFSAISDLRSSKRIREDQNGIVASYKPLAGAIVTLVYNIVVGGVIGVLGSIYYLVFVRGFVMDNESRFLALETPCPPPGGQHQSDPQAEPTEHTTVMITEQEAQNGTEKDVYVEELHNTVRLPIPKRVKDGQVFKLHKMSGTNENGEPVKKDVYIVVSIQPSDPQ